MPRIENLETEIENRRSRLSNNTEKMSKSPECEDVHYSSEIARRDSEFFKRAKGEDLEEYKNSPLFKFNEY